MTTRSPLRQTRDLRTRPLAVAAVVQAAGIVVGLLGHTSRFLPLLFLLSLALAAIAQLAERRDLLVLAALSAIALAGALLGDTERRRASDDCRRVWQSGQEVRLRALAEGFLADSERGSVRVRPLSAAGAGCVWRGPLRVFVAGPVEPGRVYDLQGHWRPNPRPSRLPRPPERWGWLAADGAEATGNGGGHYLLELRGALQRRIWAVYPRRWAPLVEALTLGQRESVEPEVHRRWARAGLAHVLAISGLHVGLIAAALSVTLRVLFAPTVTRPLVLTLLLAYVCVIGAPASAVRAAMMICFWLLGRMAGRSSSSFDALGLAAILLMLIRPWSVLGAGAQLSFAAAASLAFAQGWLPSGRVRGSRVASAAVSSVAVSVAVLLTTAPITAAHFGRIAPASVLGNLIAVPLLGLTMPALFASVLAAPWPGVAVWAAAAAIPLLHGLDALARRLAERSWASFDVPAPDPLIAAAYFALLILAARAAFGRRHRPRLVLALGVAMGLSIVWPAVRSTMTPERLRIYVLDVGQGEAVAISTPHRRWLLIDAGPRTSRFDAGARRVVPFLRGHGARRLEAWLVSHPDLDHVGGGPAVLRALDVGRAIGPGRITGQTGQLSVLRELAGSSVDWMKAASGATLAVDRVVLRFVHPPAGGWSVEQESDPNVNSLVFLLEYGQFRMLFTGDAPASVEDRLVGAWGAALRASVLKIGHHGSASSTTQRFLDVVDPDLAIISAGRGNRYGHPAPIVLGRLLADSVMVRRTDQDGTVILEAESDGRWWVRNWAEGY